MPLFGPNIKKMKEKGDVKGLIQLIVHKDAKIRIEATKALTELKSIDALAQEVSKNDNPSIRVGAAQILKGIEDTEAIEGLTNALLSAIRLGNSDDQVEAMIVIQGRVPTSLVKTSFLPDRQEALENVRGSLELHRFQSLLDEVVREGKSYFSKWFALVTLVELGDCREEVLKTLISYSASNTKAVDELLEERAGQRDFALYLEANTVNCLIEETVRALASLGDNAIARDAVIKILEGEFLCGSYVHPGKNYSYLHPRHQENAICALGAIGDPSTRERLEYLANRGSEAIRRDAKVALELYGKATYDKIKNKAESN